MEVRYGKWTVLERSGRRWLCRCDCGTERKVIRSDLWAGKSTNCGCVRRVTMKAAQMAAETTHGLSESSEFRIWTDMRRRCHNPSRPDYHRYGGRGIEVCPEWRESFEAFYRDMGPRLAGHTLDREDNDGPYSKANCKWATRKAQGRNTRVNRYVSIAGEQLTVAEACERYGITKN